MVALSSLHEFGERDLAVRVPVEFVEKHSKVWREYVVMPEASLPLFKGDFARTVCVYRVKVLARVFSKKSPAVFRCVTTGGNPRRAQ